MAKPRQVAGVRPHKRVRPNARRILAVRIDEVWAYGDDVRDPGRVTELHDMRIAFKRLRYLLEIFDVAFAADLEPFIDEVKDLQDVLGDVHDCDVQVPLLEEHLAMLEVHGGVTDAGGGGDERPGIRTLIARRRAQREQTYAAFLTEWDRLQREGFRGRLEAALGIAPGA